MLYKGLKIGVFYKNKSWAEKWFSDFINKVDNVCILRYVRNRTHPFFIELRDRTRITAYKANESARGICIDKAFVEPTVGSEIIDSVIRPLLGHTRFVEIED
ncbi:MAG: hypothetical protein Q4A54_00530 [Parabacteroides sp.]|nr:hypothetical protein [Parabacteroides sp.]